MNNSDFQRLLTTNDRELVTQLTQRKKGGAAAGPYSGAKGKGKGRGKDEKAIARIQRANKYKQRALEKELQEEEEPKYRDRAAERREQKNEYEKVAAEFESHGEVSVEQSKYLGGDLEHTHLVKGLDFALLNKVRGELMKKQKVDEVLQARRQKQQEKQQEKKAAEKKKSFDSKLAKSVWATVVDTLHPHHSTFKERVKKMGKAISQGHHIRNAPSVFLPGRMAYEFDTDLYMGNTDIPAIIYMSKEDIGPGERHRLNSGALPDQASKVRDAMVRGAERRKLRKESDPGAAYAAPKQEKPKPKARDADDIFSGAGSFDAEEFVEKARAEKAAKAALRAVPGPPSLKEVKIEEEEQKKKKKEEKKKKDEAPKVSYFDDAGDEKYRKAPERQLDLHEIEVEESTLEPGQFHKPTGRFAASKKFKGFRKNWVFKLGEQGLGYYEEVPPKKKVEDAPPEKDPRKRKAAKSSGASGMGNPSTEAYDELFPSAMLGGAMMTTVDEDSDDDDKKKKKGEKKNKIDEDTVSAHKNSAATEARKRKATENQQWQKIDNMLKKGKVSSFDTMEQQASKRTGKTSHLATPAFF